MKLTQSAGGVVLNPTGQILVVNQRGTSWSLPKGHLEEGEDEIIAAKREIYEETGIADLKLVKKLGSYQRHRIDKYGGEDKSEFKTIAMFLLNTNQEELKPIDHHNPEARWVDPDEVADLLTHPKDKAFYLSIIGQVKSASPIPR